ncbi:MAG: tetratricopeptide repeat protein [Anaerolineae bacterium]|nr:tetratricopeptide repeat protein [Anaerolineae bacterium]NUQ06870.1 tetratricopeptide repeat protein [Anaerolineae bacterium]
MAQPPKPKDMKKLDAIDDLRRRKRHDEALQASLEFTRERPKVAEGWEQLAEIAVELKKHFYLWKAARTLTQLEPQEDAYAFNLAFAAMNMECVFLTRQSLDRYLQRFPQGSMLKRITDMKTAVDSYIQDMIAKGEVTANVSIDDMADFELGRFLITHGDTTEGRRLSLQAARNLPDFASPLNNVCLSYMVEGDLAKAQQTIDEILAKQPDNLFARGTKVQLLVRLGRLDEAQPLVEALAQESPENPDHWVKIMESCAYAHDHQRVIAVYKRAIPFFKAQKYVLEPALHHFAGTAHAFLGAEAKAMAEWKKVPHDHLYGAIARSNLREFRQHGAWYFSFSDWIPRRWLEAMITAIERGGKRGEEAVEREFERLQATTPGFAESASLLLERGDPESVTFALQLAKYYPLPGLAAFARSRRGKDEQRIEAANLASRYGLLPRTESVTLTIEGEPRELLLLGFDIYTEPEDDGKPLPKAAQAHLKAGFNAYGEADYERALSEAQQGLALVPKSLALLNHLAAALHQLNRHDEADEVNRRLAAEHPDYLFARVAMADIAIRDGRLDEAYQWIEPLLTRQRYHISEFRAVTLINIRYWQVKGELSSARHWIQMLDQVDPDSVTDNMRLLETLSGAMDAVRKLTKKKK